MKMKNIILTVIAALMTVCCSTDDSLAYDNGEKEFLISFGGEFRLESVTDTRSSDGMTDIWLFDYMDGELLKCVWQGTSDVSFGNVRISLPYGKHTLCVVASSGENPVVDTLACEITWAKPGDTFHRRETLEVNAASPSVLNIEMKRVSAQLKVRVDDGFPWNASEFVMHGDGWNCGLNWMTGDGCSPEKVRMSEYIPLDMRGTDRSAEYIYYEIYSESSVENVRIDAVDGYGNSLVGAELEGVVLERGKTTTFSGNLLDNNESGLNISIGTEEPWIDGKTGTF